MDNKKICFITCVSDDKIYEKCLSYINDLNKFNDYTVDVLAIRDSANIAKSYNEALRLSDAKYKVYIPQDTYILNKNFIKNILDIFTLNEDIAMLGVVGYEDIHLSANWWQCKNKFGKVIIDYNDNSSEVIFNDNKDIKCVNGIDKLLMATQYDTLWREDLFDKDCFYNLSQSIEFKRKGYKTAVVNQDTCWCMTSNDLYSKSNYYDEYKKVFLKEYSKDLFPLVSILIPCYNNKEFFEQALKSALNQTYQNTEIIIGDDSTNDDIKNIIDNYLSKYKNIKYINNNGPLGGYGKENVINLFKLAKGEYISYLYHDDLYIDTRIEHMMDYFITDKSVSLIASSRNIIDSSGNILQKLSLSQGNDIKFSGKELIKHMLSNQYNYIGEPSTAMFKKDTLSKNIFDLENQTIYSLLDLSIWCDLLSKGDLIYIDKTLSSFRRHENQNSNNTLCDLLLSIDLFYLMNEYSKEKYKYFTSEERKNLLIKWYIAHKDLESDINKFIPNENDIDLYNSLKLEMNKINKKIGELVPYRCSCCNYFIDFYIPLVLNYSEPINKIIFENDNRDKYYCPICQSSDRERMYVKYIKNNKEEDFKNNKNILHIAPEPNLRKYINSITKNSNYICGDLYPTDSGIQKIDITDICFDDEYFDIIICSHVLEHVINDIKAMKEFYRVLKPNGWAILQVPIALNLEKTYEDDKIVSTQDRYYYYGQSDHVRIYAKDYLDRLKSVGFKVYEYNFFKEFGEEESKKLGLVSKDCIYIVRK